VAGEYQGRESYNPHKRQRPHPHTLVSQFTSFLLLPPLHHIYAVGDHGERIELVMAYTAAVGDAVASSGAAAPFVGLGALLSLAFSPGLTAPAI
jgi:hypothetical protein